MGQVWGTNTLGGYAYSDQLSKVLRTALQPMIRFRQFCDADDASSEGLHAGSAYNWNVYSDVGTQGGVLTENVPIPETNFTISQASLMMVELGNSVPFTGLLDDMSAQPIEQIIQKTLKNDANKALETQAHAQFDATLLVVSAASGTSTTEITVEEDGAITATNNVALNDDHIKKISDQMKERNIPAYDGSNYCAVGRPATFRAFKDAIEAVHSYVDRGFSAILEGEVGRHYEGIRFFEQTAIASESWSNAKSDAVYFFGEDTVMEAIAIPEEIRGKLPTDYGRSKGFAWLNAA
jgi:N4-gp56 family major capsid protein